MPSPRSPQSSKKPFLHKPLSRPSARSTRPTVLHLCSDLEPGDPGRETVDLAVLAQRAGWRSLIASNGGLLVAEAERAAVRHTRMPIDGRGLFPHWRVRLKLAALIQREKPALLHAHGIEAAACAYGFSRIHHLPFIVDFTRPLQDEPRLRRLFKQLGRTSCIVRVPSEFMERQLREFGWPAERLRLIPPGIDMKWFDAGAISAERLQALGRLWRLPEQAAIVVVPMPFTEGGGHEFLLKALARLKRDEIFTVMVGDNCPTPGIHEILEDKVERLGLNGKVVMPDFCLDWPAACWLASVVVAVNDAPRGQNTELLAAQAMGRPVIVTDCGANYEMAKGGETAWVVMPNDDALLAEALKGAIGLSTSDRVGLAARTRDFAIGFAQDKWATAMLALYESARIPAAKANEAKAA